MIYAPERPTTQELYEDNLVDRQMLLSIAASRIAINSSIVHPDNKFLLVGPCALTDDAEILADENDGWMEFAAKNGLVVAVRRHPWKPRSVKSWAEKMKKWHGLETGFVDGIGEPEYAAQTAFKIMHQEAKGNSNVSMEIAFDKQIFRYGPLLSFAQIGARTRDEYYDNYVAYLRFLDFLAKREPTLPIGIKNDLDGSIDRAMEEVDRVNDIRSKLGMSAVSRAVLIYRGGSNAKTPNAWIAGAEDAISRTRGAVILDVAHGGEQAFDPHGKYEKSEPGQLNCLGAAMKLGKCVGKAIETSGIKSPMDPPASPEKARASLEGKVLEAA